MAGFSGGSAWAMAREISEGYVSITDRTLFRMREPDQDKLLFELNRLMRTTRGNQPDADNLREIQNRNRKLQRITGAVRMVQGYIQRTRRRG